MKSRCPIAGCTAIILILFASLGPDPVLPDPTDYVLAVEMNE